MNAQLNAQPSGPSPRFTARTADDIEKLPEGGWLVYGVLPAQGIAGIYGASQAGKSTLAFHLAQSLSVGEPWFGRDVDAKFRVMYLVLEGRGGLKGRVRAISTADRVNAPNSMRFFVEPFRINDATDIADLAAEIKRVGGADLVIIDTLNCAAPEADENSSRDMGSIIAGAKELQATVGGLVVLVHHVGKDSARGLRGHSSLLAALDAAILVSRDGERRSWKLMKSRDSEDGVEGWFRLESVEVGKDAKGRPQTATVVRPNEGPPPMSAAPVSLGSNQKIAYQVLFAALGVMPDVLEGEVTGPVGIPWDSALADVAECLTAVEPRKRRERAKDAIQSLVGAGLLLLEEGRICLPDGARE